MQRREGENPECQDQPKQRQNVEEEIFLQNK